MKNVSGYAKLVGKAEPTYIEVKAYMHVGFSRLRLGYQCMPSYKEIKGFAEDLSRETGYRLINEASESRVVLMSKLATAIRFDTCSN